MPYRDPAKELTRTRERVKRRKAGGLCWCKEPKVAGKSLCPKHLACAAAKTGGHNASWEIRLELFKAQNGLCPITLEPLDINEAHVDHNHITGEIRGLLSSRANRAIGFLHDDPEEVGRALEYLRKNLTSLDT